MSKSDRSPIDQYTELENQFILRLPVEAAQKLHELLRNGTSLKDRLTIKLENNVRKGEVRFDNWLFNARVFDLPSIIESVKTLDNKNTYKTADICQIMVCKEEEWESDEESSKSKLLKRRDPLKVDKKYLWPHGVTPPLKNVRRRRFRRTLKKVYQEGPEIEKEVKRLLRGDCEALNVRWELVDDEETLKKEEASSTSTKRANNLAEHDIFGAPLSDTDDEAENVFKLDDENSRLSGEDSNSRSSNINKGNAGPLMTEFSEGMFKQDGSVSDVVIRKAMVKLERCDTVENDDATDSIDEAPSSSYYSFDVFKTEQEVPPAHTDVEDIAHMSHEEIAQRMNEIQNELAKIKERRHQQESELSQIENQALKQRFNEIIEDLFASQLEKEQEYQQLAAALNDRESYS